MSFGWGGARAGATLTLTLSRMRARELYKEASPCLKAVVWSARRCGPYAELGEDFFERHNIDGLTRYHVDRLQRLGYKVDLSPVQEAA